MNASKHLSILKYSNNPGKSPPYTSEWSSKKIAYHQYKNQMQQKGRLEEKNPHNMYMYLEAQRAEMEINWNKTLFA